MKSKLSELLSHYKAQYEKALIEKGRLEMIREIENARGFTYDEGHNDMEVKMLKGFIEELEELMDISFNSF
nr:MAG TPA: hypothetical protein [Caudoviricetes sp.]